MQFGSLHRAHPTAQDIAIYKARGAQPFSAKGRSVYF